MDRVLNTSTPVRKLQFPAKGQLAANPARTAASNLRAPVRQGLNPTPPPQPSAPDRISSFHKVGLFCCCGYLISGFANDLSTKALGSKAYLSYIFGILLIITFLGCGTALRGTLLPIGKWWAAIAVLLVVSTAFSMNRGLSIGMLETFIPRSLCVYYYCTAFAFTLRNCRTLITANIIATSAILVSATFFGGGDEGGRFCIPGSLFFGNSNDLALALVCSLGFSLFLIWQKTGFAKILGAVEFVASVLFMLKTGSRGGFLALAACLIVWLMFSNKRGSLIALAVPSICLIAFLPGSILSRLVEIAAPSTLEANTGDTAQMSQFERTELLKKSIRFAVSHPLFGTGPGTFPDALYFDDMAHGTHTVALNTHNTYTQIASECGFPILFLYLGVLFGSIKLNYRIMTRTRHAPGADNVFTMSVCLLGSLVAYAVGSAFDHVGYTWTLPLLSGISVALHVATRGGDPQWIQAETAAGNA